MHTRTQIADWFSAKDRRPGDSPAKLRKLGLHRFQTYVRYQLAPSLKESTARSSFLPHVVLVLLFLLPGIFDGICQPSVNFWDTLASLAVLGTCSTFGAILSLSAFETGALVFHFMRERCRLPSWIVFPIALVLSVAVFMMGFMSGILIPGPAKVCVCAHARV